MAIIIGHQSQKQKAEGITDMAIGDSSFIQNIKYDPTNLQLTVTMKNGGEYVHFHVYPQIVDSFITSPSKGKFYSQAIKGKYASTNSINKNIGRITKNAG